MVEAQQATADAFSSSSSSTPVTATVVAPHRRPRVREVSSRFMSPVPSSTPSASSSVCCGDVHMSVAKSPAFKQQRRHHSTEENRPIETVRSLESPFQVQFHSAKEDRHRRSVTKLFNENVKSKVSRPDTPIVMSSSSSSSLSKSRASCNTATATAATKLLQSLSSQPQPHESASSQSHDRLLAERNINITSPCSRSLNLPILTSAKPTSALSRSYTNSHKTAGFSLPPVPPPVTESRKVKKISNHQEDVHSLRLLHNRLMQWRFANAKAQVSTQSQATQSRRTLYSLGVKMSTLYDSVERKRVELSLLQRRKTLLTILEAQMPYLDEWCGFEGDYSVSLSETIQALLNTLLQLPINGNVKADVREVSDAVNAAIKLMDIIFSHVQSFVPKAEEMENLMIELAKVVGEERAFIEDCGDALSKTYISQVEECSLRSQLLELHRCRLTSQFKEENSHLRLSLPTVDMR